MTAIPALADFGASPETLAETRDLIGSGEISAAAHVEARIEAIAAARELHAFITETPELARAQAERADERRRRGEALPLQGVSLSIKDNFCTFGIKTTAGSRLLEEFIPRYESFVSGRVREAGALIVGKTNMDEFGMGSSTENSAFGPTLNPLGVEPGRDRLSPGGSSGGAAASVAANLCAGALATDTGGSIRQPAAFCGVVGFKPTYGVCSRWGIVAYASSLDQAGVITRNVRDAAILMDVIAGFDPKDSTSLERGPSGFEAALAKGVTEFSVGIPKGLREEYRSPELEQLWSEAERLIRSVGGNIVYIDLPLLKQSLPTYYILALCEASSNLARYDGVRYGFRRSDAANLGEMYELTRGTGFNWETKRRIMLGTYALSAGFYEAYFVRAQKWRARIADELNQALRDVQFLMWPTAPTPAFALGAHQDPVLMYLEDVFTVPVNLAGLPAISLPIFKTGEGLPMGMQLIGPALGDTALLAAADRVMDGIA